MLLITSHFVCNKEGIDYNDINSVIARVPETLWITAESCKYMLACFVHKSNPEISTQKLHRWGVGAMRESGHKVKNAALEEVCVVLKAARPVGKGVWKSMKT
jgi:hypothetical protein